MRVRLVVLRFSSRDTEWLRRDGRALRAPARDVLRNGRHTCTSPQVVYVDTDDRKVLFTEARALPDALAAEADALLALQRYSRRVSTVLPRVAEVAGGNRR
nr:MULTISPECIES: acyl-CoA reductase [Streptomyces]